MTDLVKHPTLYNVDSKGKARIWYMETEGGKHRTVSGLIDGKQVTSGWVVMEAKNVGRSNATTEEEQALVEMKADYKMKLKRKYYETLGEAQEAGSGMKFTSPMLAEKWKDVMGKKKPPSMLGAFTQPKFDGFRCIAKKTGLFSRNGEPIVSCPHIHEALKGVFAEIDSDTFELPLDGELYNHEFRDDFDSLSSIIGQKKPTPEDIALAVQYAEYHIYDVIIPSQIFSERWSWVNEVIKPMLSSIPCIKFTETTGVSSVEEVDTQHEKNLEAGYEGTMIRLNDYYVSKRTKSLIKRKEFYDAEYEILEILPGKGNWAGAAKKALCRDKVTGETFESGIRGKREVNKQILEDYHRGIVPKEATVRYPNLTPRGVPRFGQITKWWPNGRNL